MAGLLGRAALAEALSLRPDAQEWSMQELQLVFQAVFKAGN